MKTGYTLGEWASVTRGNLLGDSRLMISEILTDSRDYVPGEGEVMFAALRTNSNDGHRYIPSLIKSGVRAFLVDDPSMAEWASSSVYFVIVNHVLEALHAMAAFHRKTWKGQVTGITGSNGKTIVKEWLAELLQSHVDLYRSPASYNSQIGVPLSILNVRRDYAYYFLEAGISRKGEMEKLQSMIVPDKGIFTWFGEAHQEGFSGEKEKWNEKMHLFKTCSRVLIHLPQDKIFLWKEDPLNHAEVRIVSEWDQADYRYHSETCIEEGSFKLYYQGEVLICSALPFRDEASVRNLATCLSAIHWFFPEHFQNIIPKISQLKRIHTRLDISRGIQNSLLIHDYYTSDPDSLKIALKTLYRQAGPGRKKILILSEFDQLGLSPEEMKNRLENIIRPAGIHRVFLIGPSLNDLTSVWPDDYRLYSDVSSFLRDAPVWKQELTDAIVLIKGARKFALEQVSRELVQQSHQTVLEIYPNRILHNLRYFRSLLRPGVKIMAMIKAMGYGTGATELALFLQQSGIDYLAVAFADEGSALRKAGIHIPVMVMNPEEEGWETCIRMRLEPVLYSFSCLEKLKRYAYLFSDHHPVKVHIEVDTGMKRLGFTPEELLFLGEQLKWMKGIKVQSVFSHFVAAEDPAMDDFTNLQWKKLLEAAEAFKHQIRDSCMIHICNTSGTLRFPHAHADMVRPGIGLYGIGCGQHETHMKFALRWVTRVSQVHKIQPGDSVGYNRRYIAEKEGYSATLPLGYADGFLRVFGNGRAGVKIRGKYFRTLGNICMDMCMIDAGEKEEIKEDEEVIVFENSQDLEMLCRAAGSISYEIISLISSRVKRIYIYD